jgi:FkbM family methyltransferase
LTDDPNLRSDTWQVRFVPRLFGMDPVRSQRDLKIRPHLYLPEFEVSLYIDNDVLLREQPRQIFELFDRSRGFCLPHHSYRETVLDEFLAVAEAGLDDQGRIFEQLNHYVIDCPEVLEERPLWTGILLRDHQRPAVRHMLELWAAHVNRYSRRDQLSVNLAFRRADLEPQILRIDTFASPLHTWPHHDERDTRGAARRLLLSSAPAPARVRHLEQALAEEVARNAALDRKIAEQIAANNALAGSLDKEAMRNAYLRAGRTDHETQEGAAWGISPARILKRVSGAGTTREVSPTACVRTRTGAWIYVDPLDERGVRLLAQLGDLNPVTLGLWRRLMADGQWTHVIDIGANYGEMLANGGIPRGVRVLAIEPSPRVRPYLERTLTGAGVNAEVLATAVSDTEGEAELLVDRLYSGTTRLVRPHDSTTPPAFERIPVRTTTLAALLRRRGRLDRIRALVKIDVEGHEVAVLQGVLEVLDQLAAFTAVIEILHVPDEDLARLLGRFDLEFLNRETDRLEPVIPATPSRMAEMRASAPLYTQDIVVRKNPPAVARTIGARRGAGHYLKRWRRTAEVEGLAAARKEIIGYYKNKLRRRRASDAKSSRPR